MIGLVAAFAVALLVTNLATPPVIRLATRMQVLDTPGGRHSHDVATPRWGGIAIYLGTVAAAVLAISYRHWRTDGANGWTLHLAGLLVAATLIAIVGIVDDMHDLRPSWQIAGIAAAAAVLMFFGVRIEGITNPLAGIARGSGYGSAYDPTRWLPLPLPVSVLVTVAWVLGVTKTVDAIDGLDGLAAGVCAISAATLALLTTVTPQPGGPAIGLVAASIVGACIGFLRYNFNPARVFMGTVGAQFLGFMLAGVSIMGPFKAAAAVSVAVPLLVLGVPIFDYVIVVFRRLLHGAPLTQGDQRHFHHRLLQRGLTHRQAVYVIYVVTFVLCAAAFVLFALGRSSS